MFGPVSNTISASETFIFYFYVRRHNLNISRFIFLQVAERSKYFFHLQLTVIWGITSSNAVLLLAEEMTYFSFHTSQYAIVFSYVMSLK